MSMSTTNHVPLWGTPRPAPCLTAVYALIVPTTSRLPVRSRALSASQEQSAVWLKATTWCQLQDTKLQPNSFVFIGCPDASRSQHHPFTLALVRNSTRPDEPACATIYCKPYGGWVQVWMLSNSYHCFLLARRCCFLTRMSIDMLISADPLNVSLR